jgi:hypothetical protein
MARRSNGPTSFTGRTLEDIKGVELAAIKAIQKQTIHRFEVRSPFLPTGGRTISTW